MDPRVESRASTAESLDRSSVSGATMLRLAMLAGVAVGLGIALPRPSSTQPTSDDQMAPASVAPDRASDDDAIMGETPAR